MLVAAAGGREALASTISASVLEISAQNERIPVHISDFKITKDDLHNLPGLVKRLDERGEPSFLVVVALSGVVLMCVFLGAVLIVGVVGARMLPNIHKPDLEPTSMMSMPAPVWSRSNGAYIQRCNEHKTRKAGYSWCIRP